MPRSFAHLHHAKNLWSQGIPWVSDGTDCLMNFVLVTSTGMFGKTIFASGSDPEVVPWKHWCQIFRPSFGHVSNLCLPLYSRIQIIDEFSPSFQMRYPRKTSLWVTATATGSGSFSSEVEIKAGSVSTGVVTSSKDTPLSLTVSCLQETTHCIISSFCFETVHPFQQKNSATPPLEENV